MNEMDKMSGMNLKVIFEVEKSTKNTIRFAEVENNLGPAPAVGTLYVQKWAVGKLADTIPTKLEVTIEAQGALKGAQEGVR